MFIPLIVICAEYVALYHISFTISSYFFVSYPNFVLLLSYFCKIISPTFVLLFCDCALGALILLSYIDTIVTKIYRATKSHAHQLISLIFRNVSKTGKYDSHRKRILNECAEEKNNQ